MTQVSIVKTCDMAECGFNQGQQCHAAAIQVGDPPPAVLQDPRCDTFTPIGAARSGLGAADWHAGIGACKMGTCTHNQDFRCTAAEVSIGHHGSHADCRTYRARS
jgi:hypothetical protein